MVKMLAALSVAGSASLSIGLGLDGGVVAAAVNFVARAVCPTSSLYELCDGGPPATRWLDVPDQDAVKWSVSTVGSKRMRSILTFSPLISTYTLTLNFDFNPFHFYMFHHRLVHRACFIVTVNRR